MQVMSCNELGWENLSPERTPVIVIVASSTGDGDSPDNAAKFYATMKYARSFAISVLFSRAMTTNIVDLHSQTVHPCCLQSHRPDPVNVFLCFHV